MRKILFYNWIPFDEKEGKGGGVTIYTRNLIRHFIDQPDWKVYFLSSGRAYDLLNRKPRIQKTENIYGEKCESYEIVNSPVFSSARISFSFPDKILNDESLLKVMTEFCNSVGGFDVIHYQNFEGLSSCVYRLKDSFPNTKFIYSLHNYYLFCPQVMLWRGDRENCKLDHCGRECFECMPKDVYAGKVRINQYADRRIAEELDKKHSGLKKLKKIAASIAESQNKKTRFNDEQIEALGVDFRKIEKANVDGLNRYIDRVLAVSGRVRDIAVRKGVTSEKVIVNYIGTEVAGSQQTSQRNSFDGSVLNICYLGYMRTMKGFYFLLDALEKMPDDLSAKIGIVIASPKTDTKAYDRLKELESRFASLTYYDGYSHDQLDEILKDVHLGIVPPMWEDNLPQVAIEMKAKGVAVLASNLGGAKELSSAEEFVFKAGDREDFENAIRRLIGAPSLFEKYWQGQMKLVTMEEHLKQLEEIYSE